MQDDQSLIQPSESSNGGSCQKMAVIHDTFKNFFSMVASEDDDSFFGLARDLDERTTTYVGFRGNYRPFKLPYGHSEAVYAGQSKIAFFAYSDRVFGMIDALEGRILWEKSSGSSGDFVNICADTRQSFVRVQLKKSVSSFDILTGAEVDVTQIKGALQAAGPDYSVVSTRKAFVVRTPGEELQFKSANGIRSVRRFGKHLATIEVQGPARVIDLERRTVLFEAMPEAGSQFSQIHYTHGGPIVLTQHYFDQPFLTDVRIYESIFADRWADATIGKSGSYAILSNGREIAYVTRKLFDPMTGRKIGDF